jgi:excinuclease ABC subunit A
MHVLRLTGARTNNLKSVDLTLNPGELVAITGVSGSGKSSLALDTLYAEGQRRFVESFSPYARQFLERLERPPVTSLDPIAAAVAVDRKAPIKSSRSTVATMADLEPYLSALFLRCSVPICPDCGLPAERHEPAAAAAKAIVGREGSTALVTYKRAVQGTEAFLEAREELLRDGYRRLLVRGEPRDLEELPPSEAMVSGAIEVVVDRVKIAARDERRLGAAIEEAWRCGNGTADLVIAKDGATARVPVPRGLSCPKCGRSFEPPRAGLFSYQSPLGACPTCKGFGRTIGIDWDKVVPDTARSIKGFAIRPWGGKSSKHERGLLRAYCDKHGVPIDKPWSTLTEAQKTLVLEGEGTWNGGKYPGVKAWFKWLEGRTYKMHVRVLLSRYRSYDACAACDGKRLSKESLGYRVGGIDLATWHALEIRDARARLEALRDVTGQGELVRKELLARLGYLERVGLGYITLDRQARTLSGGEAQRVSLTAALGTSLTGALFVLDEPTVGLHPTDIGPLVTAMRDLAAAGNVVVVIEHEPRVITAADRVVELGPGAGAQGGAIQFDGPPNEAARRADLATYDALAGVPRKAGPARPRTSSMKVVGAKANNLHDVSVEIPLGCVVAVTGASGSGKSTLVDEVIYRAIARARGYRDAEAPGLHTRLEGTASIKTITLVDQAPLGRTSRGNAATYTNAWNRIRTMLAQSPEAQLLGLTPGHFSFNVAIGRCEACSGEGSETVEMQFLADVSLTCPSCQGKRFKDEVLEAKINGKNAADILAMSIDEVVQFLDDMPLTRMLLPLHHLGLGYLPLGQPLSTLSGGEAQRLKLARALSESQRNALFVLDEPSAGLHAREIAKLNEALVNLVRGGGSVIVVDHDLDVIGAADWVIDLGPDAGSNGGRVVAEGTPEDVAKTDTRTGKALAAWLGPRAPLDKKKRAKTAAFVGPEAIVVEHAREHNLRDVSTKIPHGKIVVVTGPSGSGKSTLAFDVVFAEGQRRFLETLTPYARQFLPMMPRPDVDRVTGVPPSIALEQRTARAGAASTVATVTEIAHYLRLIYAKVGEARCPTCDGPIAPRSVDEVVRAVLGSGTTTKKKTPMGVYAPAVVARKGTYLDVFTAAVRAGIAEAICDGARVSTDKPPKLKKTQEHSIDLVIFEGDVALLDRASIERALAFGKGSVKVRALKEGSEATLFSTSRTCPRCGTGVPELDPRWFSFNTKQGRCEPCEGTGVKGGAEALADEDKRPEPCPACKGARLSPLPRGVRVADTRYHEANAMPVSEALAWAKKLSFEGDNALIAKAPHAELVRRLSFVVEVGLGYLALERRAITLSGGEMQRLRLAAQLGSGLTGALYVLDEPTIGLHPRDTTRLLKNLRKLADTGSTVLLVEHDADTIRAADYIIDVGPAGGRGGGRIVAEGPPSEVLASPSSPTAVALRGERELARSRAPRPIAGCEEIVLTGARENNLQVDRVAFPAGRLNVIAGVSGSGKSTLVRQVLYPAVRAALGMATTRGGAFDKLTLPKSLTRALAVDQSPIGRTPRSVPATFLGIWDEVRKLFANAPEAEVRGYGPGRFSFNASAGGRCAACEGQGVISHEMSFLPDVTHTCETCGGMRFEPATLDVRYLERSIGEVLDLTAEEAALLFKTHTKIYKPLATMCDLGLGYLHIGQGSHTLSGGEAQRLKLAAELTATAKPKPTLYVLDEPTTGLHLADVARLLGVLDKLVDRGDTLVVIEHHPAVIACADHVIELGPEGGKEGGRVVATGTPKEVSRRATATGRVLKALLV